MKTKFTRFVALLLELNDRYYIFKVTMTLVFLYLLYMGLINLHILLRSFLIMLFLAFYKWCLMNLANDESMVMYVQTKNKIKVKLFKKLDDRVINNHLYIMKLLYYFLYYFPTNWFYLVILW